MRELTRRFGSIGVFVITLHAIAWAQSFGSGSIAGTVRDATGAILPGVTVEAASPALIEKVRTVVTDEQGEYTIVDLRPGTYSVTFSLTGFNGVRREAIELTTGFTAAVNAEMRVGAVEETITVTGASPVVDTQNVRSQTVLTRTLLDTLPTARTFSAFMSLIPGASGGAGRDVGGNKGEGFAHLTIHGNGYGFLTFDGLKVNSLSGGSNHRIYINQLFTQEVVLETGGVSADSQSGGLNVNAVPKDGGNTFRGTAAGEYTNRRLQSNNLTDELRGRGLTRTTRFSYIYDAGAGFGGPIKRDKLWFYTAFRKWDSANALAGVYYNKLHGTPLYEPDLARPGTEAFFQRDFSARLTWAATQRHKITFTNSNQDLCLCWYNLGSGTMSPEATINIHYRPNNSAQLAWSFPATNRLLFDAAFQARVDYQDNDGDPAVTPEDQPYLELSRNIRYGSAFGGLLTDYGKPGTRSLHARAATSYITGSHAFKVGFYSLSGVQNFAGQPYFPVQLVLRNGVPTSLTQRGVPGGVFSKTRIGQDLGIFAQDQWRIRRMTLNLGLRFDYFDGYNPAQVRPADAFIQEFSFAAVEDVPNWKDISPRVGVTYDLFGTGKTALKAQLGRYVTVQTTQINSALNPANAIVTSTSRLWNDSNANYLPDCDLRSPLGNGECGGMANQNFGRLIVGTRYADEVLHGWGVRPYSWQGSLVLQQELRPGSALTVGYYRSSFSNNMVTQNLATGAADYDPFCVTVPSNAPLPNSGQQVCGLYDLDPSRFGVPAENLVIQASDIGKIVQRYDGIDITVSARLPKGALLSGGMNVGRDLVDVCAVTTSRPDVTGTIGAASASGALHTFGPLRSAEFCRVDRSNTEFKLAGSYPLPIWALQVSGTLQLMQGIPLSASYVATNAELAASLGRNLAGCPATGSCNQTLTIEGMVEPYSVWEKRNTQLDLRVGKSVNMGRARLMPRVDIYNVFNANAVTRINDRLGFPYLTPTDVLGGRVVKFGGQLDF